MVARVDGRDIAIGLRLDARHVIADVLHTEIGDAVIAQALAKLAGVEVVGIVGDRRVLGRRAWAVYPARTVRLKAVVREGGGMALEPAGDQVGLVSCGNRG